MTGGFRYEPATHERAVLELDDGDRIAYRDLRRFGTWLLLEPEEARGAPGDPARPRAARARFTTAFLAGRLAGRRAPVKAAMLDQRTVAGSGNIYADEALWHARIHPLRPGGRADDRGDRGSPRGASGARCAAASAARAPISATAPTPAGGCSESSASTAGPASPATAAGRRSRRPAPAAAARGTAPTASVRRRACPIHRCGRAPRARRSRRSARSGDEDLGHRPAAGQLEQRLPEMRVVLERDLLVGEARDSSSALARTQ